MGLDGCWVEVGVLLSLTSVWGGVPLENEEGGNLVVALVFGFIDVGLTIVGGDLVPIEEGPDLVVGEAMVGCSGVLGISIGSGSTGF